MWMWSLSAVYDVGPLSLHGRYPTLHLHCTQSIDSILHPPSRQHRTSMTRHQHHRRALTAVEGIDGHHKRRPRIKLDRATPLFPI